MPNSITGTKMNINIDRATKQQAKENATANGLTVSAYIRQLIHHDTRKHFQTNSVQLNDKGRWNQ